MKLPSGGMHFARWKQSIGLGVRRETVSFGPLGITILNIHIRKRTDEKLAVSEGTWEIINLSHLLLG